MNNINTLTNGTINGLSDLSLDTLTTTNLNSDTIDGNLIYYNRIEGNEIIVDTRLTLTNTGVISVGSALISDVELTYLDGVSSNIQTQINNINTNNSGLITTVNTHTTQISALQATDITHTNQISTLQGDVSNLQISYGSQATDITTLQNKTVWQSASGSATTFSKQINIPNGNIGYINSLFPNNFYIQSNLASGNNINLNSGLANIYLQSQNIYLGKTDASTGRKSNLLMLASDGTTWETQSSAFTEDIKNSYTSNSSTIATHTTQITALQTSDTTQNTSITTLNNKCQNFTADTTQTAMTKQLQITTNGECVKLIGSSTILNAYTTGGASLDWSIGQPSSGSKKVQLINNKEDGIYLYSGLKASTTYSGLQPLNMYNNGINLYRGGIESGNTLLNVGSIGATTASDNNFYINGNSFNNIILYSGFGTITLSSSTVWVGNSYIPAGNGRCSNINMLNSNATAWETQSSAFTETLKGQILTNQTNITALTTRLDNVSNFGIIRGYLSGSQIAGRTIPFTASTVYGLQSTLINIGLFTYGSGYTAYFNSIGACILTNCFLNVKFQLWYECHYTGINTMRSRIKHDNWTTPYDKTLFQGVKYNGNQTFNDNLHYEVNLKINTANGKLIYLDTESYFTFNI